MSKTGIIPPDPRDVERELKREIERAKKKIVTALQYAGEVGINKARDPHLPGTYTDRSGNLRSSVGYVVHQGGKVAAISPFEQVNNSAEGADEGRSYAREIAREASENITLSLVAGKEYASYVEAKGYNVLDSAVIEAKATFKQLMEK